MGSALLDTLPGSAPEHAAANNVAAAITNGAALRQQAAERLAAHRSRRAGVKPGQTSVEQAAARGSGRAAEIAAAVAERYSHQQSYHAFLAAEAERAVLQARAAAEVAAIQAQAMEAAQQSLLDALENEALENQALSSDALQHEATEVAAAARAAHTAHTPEEMSFWPEAAQPPRRPKPQRASVAHEQQQPIPQPQAAPAPPVQPFAVRLEHELSWPELRRNSLKENLSFERDTMQYDGADAIALDEEIAFRQAPVFEDFSSRPEPLPANLIQFPRQLVASRKARPRLAEGPLREEVGETEESQLRIFEVEPGQISTQPASEEAEAPQWTSIHLGASPSPPETAPEPTHSAMAATMPGIASVERRTVAAAINGVVIGIALAAFGAAACITSGNAEVLHSFSLGTLVNSVRTPEGRVLLGAAAMIALLLCLAYQALFFTFSSATPGMRCARIALCTFRDENPTRRAIRRRILAVLLSGVPFGLGFIWAVLDEEKLSWHDRVSGLYQREY